MFFTNVDSALHTLAGRSRITDALVEATAQTGLYVALVLAVILLWPRREALRAGLAAACGAVLALGGGALVGVLWNRPRPFVDGQYAPLIAHAADASFPSDHLIAVGTLAAAAWLVWRPAGLVLAIVGGALATARAVAGIHYASDLLGGFVMGAAATSASWWLLGRVAASLVRLEGWADPLPFRPPSREPRHQPEP